MSKIIGLSGLSSSGKTTVAKALLNVLHSAQLLHQDDFYFPPEQIPYDPILKEQNWDSPEAIDFRKFTEVLARIQKESGFKYVVDSLEIDETTAETKLSEEQVGSLQEKIRPYEEKLKNIYLIDGFMLFTNEKVLELLDLKLLYVAPYEQCKERRASRKGYNVIGGFWEDPPDYFDNFVWPSYYETHKSLFKNGDNEDEIKKNGGTLNLAAKKCGIKSFSNPNGANIFQLVDETLEYILKSI